MGKLEKVKNIWNTIKSEWKTRYRLVFSNEDTHEQNFVIRRITIQKMVVVAVIAAFVVILLTTLLIAFTPLRVYIPGYTTQKDYKLYKETASRVDSLEKIIDYNQKFIDNYITMLKEEVPNFYHNENYRTKNLFHNRDIKKGIRTVLTLLSSGDLRLVYRCLFTLY